MASHDKSDGEGEGGQRQRQRQRGGGGFPFFFLPFVRSLLVTEGEFWTLW